MGIKIGIYCVLVAVALAVTGCKYSQPEVQAQRMRTARCLLPPGAQDVERLDDYWYTFRMYVGGRQRRFLFGWWYGSHGEEGMTITELRD